MKKPLKIVCLIVVSIIILIVGALTYFYYNAKKNNYKQPQIFTDTSKPYVEPTEWPTFENDFFSFQYPPGLKIHSVRSALLPSMTPVGTIYRSTVNDILFLLGDWNYPKTVQILFYDFHSYGWQISIENSKFPGDLPKIADTVKRKKPLQSRYKDPEIFANDPEIFLKNRILMDCGGTHKYKSFYFFEAMVSDMELQKHGNVNGTPVFYSIQKPEFSGNIVYMCFPRANNPDSGRILILASNENKYIAILEYDMSTRTALIVASKNNFKAIPNTWRFEDLKGNLIQMTGKHCYELGMEKIPCWKSTAVYDLGKREIRKISEKRFTPILGL